MPQVLGSKVSINETKTHAFHGIEREGKTITLVPFIFTRILARDGKEAMPWNANSTLKDTLLYEDKKITFSESLKKGDTLTFTLGVQLLTAKGAKALGLENNAEVKKFRIMKRERFKF